MSTVINKGGARGSERPYRSHIDTPTVLRGRVAVEGHGGQGEVDIGIDTAAVLRAVVVDGRAVAEGGRAAVEVEPAAVGRGGVVAVAAAADGERSVCEIDTATVLRGVAVVRCTNGAVGERAAVCGINAAAVARGNIINKGGTRDGKGLARRHIDTRAVLRGRVAVEGHGGQGEVDVGVDAATVLRAVVGDGGQWRAAEGERAAVEVEPAAVGCGSAIAVAATADGERSAFEIDAAAVLRSVACVVPDVEGAVGERAAVVGPDTATIAVQGSVATDCFRAAAAQVEDAAIVADAAAVAG